MSHLDRAFIWIGGSVITLIILAIAVLAGVTSLQSRSEFYKEIPIIQSVADLGKGCEDDKERPAFIFHKPVIAWDTATNQKIYLPGEGLHGIEGKSKDGKATIVLIREWRKEKVGKYKDIQTGVASEDAFKVTNLLSFVEMPEKKLIGCIHLSVDPPEKEEDVEGSVNKFTGNWIMDHASD